MRQLLQGAPAKVKATFGLTSGSAGDYPLTSCGGCTKVEGVDDGIEFNATVEAMKV
jgi:myosin heavy subunit